MKRRIMNTYCLAFAGLLLISLAGCGKHSPPVTFYNLSPMESASPMVAQAAASNIVLGIGPVSFPESLRRAQLAIRVDEQRVKYDEFHRWSGSLAEDFSRVLLEDLATSLPPSAELAIYPWDKYFQPTHRVKIDVARFDGALGGEVTLDARWIISDDQNKKRLGSYKSVIKTQTRGNNYLNLVTAQSETIAKLAQEIALSLARQ